MLQVRFRPVLFAGLLNHWGQLGPAEIEAKKRHTFLLTRWRAQKLELPFKAPPRHPFNPLTVLRLAIALGSDSAAIGVIFDHIWADGQDGQDPDSLARLAEQLGIDDLAAATSDAAVKDQLRLNTESRRIKRRLRRADIPDRRPDILGRRHVRADAGMAKRLPLHGQNPKAGASWRSRPHRSGGASASHMIF